MKNKIVKGVRTSALLMGFFAVLAAPLMQVKPVQAAGHVGSPTCPPTGPTLYSRAICDGYFTGADQWNAGVDVNNILLNPGGNGALWGVGNVDDFIDKIEAGLNGGSMIENTGTAFLIESMLGKQGTDFTTIPGGIAQAKADFSYWEDLVRWYDMKGYVDWNANDDLTTMSNFVNSGVSTKETLDALFFMDVGPKDRPLITFTNPDGSTYVIDKNCANPTGIVDPLSPSGWSLAPLQPKVGVGNFVWFDSNNDGIVNQLDASQGFNGVKMDLYTSSADTNNDGTLSAAEVAAATPAATDDTADDNRAGSPTNGDAGYYEFGNLDPGGYFICIAATNFTAGALLERYAASPVPSGTGGDSQTDRSSHGVVPAGGTMQTSGLCASETTLQEFTEPTNNSGSPDDDDDFSTDETIDFGFWHPYSLGNRVWIDKDNSGDMNAADGPAPGVKNATVALYDCAGAKLATTTTDDTGHYRFDNLAGGCYQAEVEQSNFDSGSALQTCNMSSTGPKQSANPDNNIDSDDNGIDPAKAGMSVRSGSMHLGPFNSEPINEADVAVSGQGTDDDFANMTLDFGFICNGAALADTGQSSAIIASVAGVLALTGGALAVRNYRVRA